jgi:hypothetical protein
MRGWRWVLGAALLSMGLAPAVRSSPRVAHASALAEAYDAALATAWFDLALSMTQRTAGFSPPVASRAFGYLGVTLYESIVAGMPAHRSLAGQLNELDALPRPEGRACHWPTVANSALAEIARGLYAGATAQAVTNGQSIDALEAYYGSLFAGTLPPAVYADSVAYGRSIAAAIFGWSMSDGGHEGYLRNLPASYTPPAGPGMWVPTPPAFSHALQPYWGENRPFVLPSGEACAPPPPLAYSEDPASAFYGEGFEVYETVNQLSEDEREIALYWSDDPGLTVTPPGHSISIATQVIRQQGSTLAAAAEVYARVGIAVADAFISCWNAKYRYTLIRPVSYIRNVIDPTWGASMPLTTPPFPEYTSGHSVQSGAAAEVLTYVFGPLPFTDTTNVHRGFPPRSFSSFFAFADEAAVSRLYGGIHYRHAIEQGLLQGRCVGKAVEGLTFGVAHRH